MNEPQYTTPSNPIDPATVQNPVVTPLATAQVSPQSTLHSKISQFQFLLRKMGGIKLVLNAMFVIVVIAGLSAGTILNLKPGGTFDSRRYAADNMCNVNPGSCKTEQDWINGWFEARKDENKDSTPKQDEYTNARDDQNNNPSDGQQVEIIRHTDESGVGDPGVGNRTGEQSTVTNQITKDESGNDVISTQTTPTTTVSAQQSSTAVSLEGASPEGVSPEVQSALASQTSRCSPTLHLCPMIDPKTNQVVGWVPATQAVYGTFEDAKLARLNIDFGNGNELPVSPFTTFEPNVLASYFWPIQTVLGF